MTSKPNSQDLVHITPAHVLINPLIDMSVRCGKPQQCPGNSFDTLGYKCNLLCMYGNRVWQGRRMVATYD